LCDAIGANLQIVVNFGTMNAQDAADLVEFCNGPVTSTWGHKRDSLGHPEPFNVKYWEIGNEMDGVHMWHYSWSAQDARKYFFGGSAERRGTLPPMPDGPLFKGDFWRSRGLPNQKHLIRFPDVAVGSDSVWVGPDTSSIVLWTRVADLDSVGAGNYYEMDYENSVLKFGDGIHGNIPPSGYYILCEYTTTNHDGYVEFVDSMKSVDPTIKIGACMVPDASWSQDTIDYILQRMDFRIIHWYRHEDTTSTPDYYVRMAGPTRLFKWAYNTRRFIDTYAGIYADSIGIALTEWNWILWNGPWATPKADASLASGLFTADVLGKLITAEDELKLEVANYFCAPGHDTGYYLAFIGADYHRRSAFYAFKMFSDYFGEKLVHRDVVSDFYVVGNDAVPFITAYTSKSQSGDTLYLIVINKHDTLNYETTIEITGFEPKLSAYVYTLNGDSVYSTNEEDPMNVIIRDSVITNVSNSFTYTFPAHSVTAMEFVRNVTGISEHEALPEKFVLLQNYPNPFNPTTIIEYHVPVSGFVKLSIYDILGREVAVLVNEKVIAGKHRVRFDASSFAAGVYFYRMQAGKFQETRKLVLLK